MTALRQSTIVELERVQEQEDKMSDIVPFINNLLAETKTVRRELGLEQFVMPPTKRGQNADAYVRELRDHDRF